MNYVLKQFDLPLLKFTVEEDLASPVLKVLWVNEAHRNLLPLDLKPEAGSLSRWIRHRTIPKNRAYVHALLAKCGLNLNRPMSIIAVCKGLSLNDSYWVVEEGFEGNFDKYNLYENRFSQILGLVAFTGYGSSKRSTLESSPEFTTNGMLPKCWRRVNGKVMLYKGGTSGASNTGNEPYSEYYAAQVAQTMGIDAIEYGLSKWKGVLCSTCELFTSKDYAYMPIGHIVTEGGFAAVFDYYQQLGEAYVQALRDMLVFDAVVCNTDRHFGNFGLMIDNATNTIARPAPLFDHGNSLFNFAGKEYLQNAELLQQYVNTLAPRTYGDFIETAGKYMNGKNHDQLRRLLTFHFKRHSRYNLSSDSLRLIEEQVQKRARTLLGLS